MDSATTTLTFHIYQGDQLLRSESLSQTPIKIGKAPTANLRIDADRVRPVHAVVEIRGAGEVSMINLASAGDTLVNGQPVNKVKLVDGDVIDLGDVRIVLGVEVSVAVAAAPVAPMVASSGANAEVLVSSARPSAAQPAAFAAAAQAVSSAGHAHAGYAGTPMPALPPPQFGADASEDHGGARVIEIAAMMGDSVVHVAHLDNPRGGKIKPLTYGLFIGGAAAMLIALIAFQHGVSVATTNKKNFHAWTDVDPNNPRTSGRAAVDFRPIRMSPLWDLMAFGGLGLGLAFISFGVGRLLDERRSPWFRVGPDKYAEYPIELSSTIALVGPVGQGDDFAFSWTDGMRGEMRVDDRVVPLEQLPRTGPIPNKARIRVDVGPHTRFLISSVPAPKRQTSAFLATLEGAVMAYFLGSAAVHIGFWLLLRAIPPEAKTVVLDVLSNADRMNKAAVKPPEDPPEEKEEEKPDDEEAGGTGEKQALDEGKMGKKDSSRQSGQFMMKKTQDTPQLSKAEKQEAAQRSGLLGVMNRMNGAAFASVTGTGDESSGFDDRDIMGGLVGNEPGEMQGGWGFGTQGTGPGGGGTGYGTIGRGGYGTIGHGSGTGTGYGAGGGRGGMGGRRPLVPQVKMGSINSNGDLDKEIIRKYIRQKMPQFEYCYQKQLTINATLSGTVSTNFKIAPTGEVISATAGGMGSTEVERCVEGVIRSIRFPKPTAGGFVTVGYPFTFRTTQ